MLGGGPGARLRQLGPQRMRSMSGVATTSRAMFWFDGTQMGWWSDNTLMIWGGP
jgi:hypothetical protein